MTRVVIGLSGGVDSSVAAYLLKQQGHDVVGLFMINWHDTTGTLEGDCPWHDDRVFAELVAKKLDIPLHVVDLSADYRTRVVDYMFSEYEKGRTPNPDVLCNREIKFDVFLREALRLGADFVATGHYCRKAEETLPDGRTIYKLLAGADPNKDQSYFLCQLSQEQLRYALFPVGDLLKPEVRRIAAEQGLATAKRKDSQGICFVGKVDLPAFLQQKLASKRGNVHEILPTWPKYGPKARIPAGTPDAGQAIPAPASPAAGHSAPMSSANTSAGIGQTVTSSASEPISATGCPDGDPYSPGGQHAADVPPTTEQLAALAAPWTALNELELFKDKWDSKYPKIYKSWHDNWATLSTYFKYPEAVRRLIYTTNAIEGFNRQLRKVTKSKTVFPSDDSLLKMLYLATMDITKKWTGHRQDWGQIHSQLEIYFEERLIGRNL